MPLARSRRGPPSRHHLHLAKLKEPRAALTLGWQLEARRELPLLLEGELMAPHQPGPLGAQEPLRLGLEARPLPQAQLQQVDALRVAPR